MPNDDLISRADVLDLVQSYGPATYDMPYGSGDMIIRPEDVMALPAVDVAPVVHGRWVEVGDFIWKCSICGAEDCYAYTWGEVKRQDDLYCPHCGAKIDGGEQNATY